MEVIVFGSAIIDMICYAPRLPKAGETLHGYKFATGFGGKGANQCVAAAKLGAKCALIAKIGNDTWGDKYLENLIDNNVCVDLVEKVNAEGESTGIAQITVADSGENQIIIIPGANSHLSLDDAGKAIEHFADSKILICQQETPLDATIEILKHFKGISILNGAPALEKTPKELITLPTYLCVNETEASLMTGVPVEDLTQAKAAVMHLLREGANAIILTLGKLGAIFSAKDDSKVFHIPAKSIENVVDTTGAGDAFIGSFAYFLLRHGDLPITQLIGAACEIASRSVQRHGTQSSFCSFKEFQHNPIIWSQKYEIKEI